MPRFLHVGAREERRRRPPVLTSATQVALRSAIASGQDLPSKATALAMSPDGDELYVSGYSQTIPESLPGIGPTRIGWAGPVAVHPHVHARTLAIDPATGEIRWTAEFNSSDVGADPVHPGVDTVHPWAAALSPDGQTLLLGATFHRGHDPEWTLGADGWNFSDIGMVGYRLGVDP